MLDNELKSYLLPNLFNAAVRAGAAIMQVYKNKEDYDISIKSDKTPITVADAGRTKRSRPIWDLPVFRF